MAKNNKNTFVPPKGKPSGSGRETNGLKDAFAVTNLDEDNELAEKYTTNEDETAPNVPTKHPNRNTNKGRNEQGEETK